MNTKFSFTLNGNPQTILTDPDRPLLDVLREDFHLTGTKYGCGEGQCRACTVLLNRQSTPSCITPMRDVNGQSVRTIEGLATGGELHPAQQAFLTEGSFQCGYCTAGMIMGMAGVMEKNPTPSQAEVLEELEKHICRCGSYTKYLAAARRVVAEAQTGKAKV